MPRQRYASLVDLFAERIRSGSLAPGTRLPTVRALAREHGVALATAARVHGELGALGLVSGEAGRGTFVRDTTLPRGPWLSSAPQPDAIADLTFSYPSLPHQAEMLRSGLRRLAAEGDIDAHLHSQPNGGRLHERQAVATHLRSRGLQVRPDEVLIVNGAQHGLSMVCLALLQPGDVVAIDALTYPGMKALAAAARLRLEPVPMRDGSMDLDALDELCRRRRVRAVYTIPTLHNPLGHVMPLARRKALASLAERHDLLLIEDGAYAFLVEPAPRPLMTLAPQRCVYVSGLSKSVAFGLRFGFIAAPAALIPKIVAAIRVSTWSAPSLTVALACRWIESGEVDLLEQQKREDARERQALARRVLRGLDVVGHPSAYYLWLRLHDDLRADPVAAQLAREGVQVITAEPFATTDSIPHALRLSIGSVPLPVLEAALTKVRRAAGAW